MTSGEFPALSGPQLSHREVEVIKVTYLMVLSCTLIVQHGICEALRARSLIVIISIGIITILLAASTLRVCLLGVVSEVLPVTLCRNRVFADDRVR